MDAQLFLAPATKRNDTYQHLYQTILNGIPRQFYKQYTDTDRGDPARIWGLTSTTSSTWETIQDGDWILFYVGENEYRYGIQVVDKEHNPELGDAIRSDILQDPTDPNRDWDYLIYLQDLISVSISGEEIAEIFDYRNTYTVRFIRVTDERMEAIEGDFNSVKSFINSFSDRT